PTIDTRAWVEMLAPHVTKETLACLDTIKEELRHHKYSVLSRDGGQDNTAWSMMSSEVEASSPTSNPVASQSNLESVPLHVNLDGVPVIDTVSILDSKHRNVVFPLLSDDSHWDSFPTTTNAYLTENKFMAKHAKSAALGYQKSRQFYNCDAFHWVIVDWQNGYQNHFSEYFAIHDELLQVSRWGIV
ncbi:hypothetical protein EV182_008027, partial [Spiromyces aspiralis]